MYVKPYARQVAALAAVWTPGGTLAGALWQLFRTFCTFWALWRAFSRNFGRFGRFFFVFVVNLAL